MPTSLLSTGVQFPDSTIQTTAASGGMALISKIYTTNQYFLTFTGIASYKSILIWAYATFDDTEGLYVRLSTDNGTSYGAQTAFTNSSASASGFIQFFKTDTGIKKPFVVIRGFQNVNYLSVPSAGAVNAIQIIPNALIIRTIRVAIYGMN